jgi:succinate dehydrogenase flavin-adding protein (antitoxin of CptAB toxin-antitoxin module)
VIDYDEPILPESLKPPKAPSDVNVLRKKLRFLSSERGMLENDLLLGSFSMKHLATMNENQLRQYFALLNEPDRDVLAWITDDRPAPPELQGEVLTMLIQHVKNNPLEVLRKNDEKIAKS